MVCKNVEEYTTEYGKIADEIRDICTNRTCTLEAIQKTLEERGTVVDARAILAMIYQIEGMIFFDKHETYDVGDVITYQRGRIFKSEIIANLLVKISYKKFYLYNHERYRDDAFKAHILSKLDFEVGEKDIIKCTSDLECALIRLDIPTEKWNNYVLINEYDNKVYCMMRRNGKHHPTTICLGKFIRK